jgi:hypothetical protein
MNFIAEEERTANKGAEVEHVALSKIRFVQ